MWLESVQGTSGRQGFQVLVRFCLWTSWESVHMVVRMQTFISSGPKKASFTRQFSLTALVSKWKVKDPFEAFLARLVAPLLSDEKMFHVAHCSKIAFWGIDCPEPLQYWPRMRSHFTHSFLPLLQYFGLLSGKSILSLGNWATALTGSEALPNRGTQSTDVMEASPDIYH